VIHSWDNQPLRDLERILVDFEHRLSNKFGCFVCRENEGKHSEECAFTRARKILSSIECGDD